MIEKLRSLHDKLSTKVKTIVLVLGLFVLLSFVFVYLRYMDTRTFTEESQAFYVERIQSVYTETLKRTENFYRNRGYANLNSFGISAALEEENTTLLQELSEYRWEVLKMENPYLSSMAFYDANGMLLASLGREAPLNVSYPNIPVGFWLDETLWYRVLVPWKAYGYIMFELDPRYFLAEIVELTGLEGFILMKNNTLVSLHESSVEKLFQHSLDNHHQVRNTFSASTSLFSTHRIVQNDALGENFFEVLFFQDITPAKQRLSHAIFESVVIIMLLGVVAFVVLHWGFDVLIRRIEELNATLERRVEEEIGKRMEKEQLLVHQSKLASMGEMIGNIAHQWRQPLTQLNTILIAIELFYERGKLTPSILQEKIQEAQGQIDFMSNTVDDFRHFFAPQKQKERFNLSDTITSTLALVQSSLANNTITCTYTKEKDLFVKGYSNEVAQVLLNLISNAKDILLERNIQNPYIHISLMEKEGFVAIEVSDNGGGVHVAPIEKIFEPYVSTKHASMGTGIGLYMSKIIIEKNSHGHLHVKNTPSGACFTILLPSP
ncbi:GHKL domain-containing protein [Sulfurospirillum sp. T05]|uniref:histidine kinase n=1 Tax=Sulfurospirillum tamanense TaxID=2813362 RepID=A0ABS2WNM2_9BACT|nr:ATP-binding protein [Sulfurospirillum tamanensis]MBN2963205.1 GHKL domain-containing protein [Sulfurospirillum tamanensis]